MPANVFWKHRAKEDVADEILADTAGVSCRWRFSQATLVNCISVQIWRVEVRVRDVFANHDDIELVLR